MFELILCAVSALSGIGYAAFRLKEHRTWKETAQRLVPQFGGGHAEE